jgi:uncharacterized repeat protein (TIGR01451 family)
MEKKILRTIKMLFLLTILLFTGISVMATTSAVTVVSMTPSNPNPGDAVTIVVSYCAAAFDDTRMMLAVSQYNTIQANNTAGQTFKVDENGTDVGGTGAGDASVNGGYDTHDNPATAFCGTVTFNINIPTTFSGGGTYYIVVGARSYYTAPGSIDSQNYLQFTLPLPPPSASITKTAEDTPEFPGENILYTINYTFVNSTNFTITDIVPTNCTLVSQSAGGTSTGTTPGSTLTWAVGNTTQQKTGNVWFVVNIGAGAASSTIHNTANWTTTEIPAGGSSADAPVVVGPATFTITKSESESTGVIGDMVTYGFDFQAGGMFFNSYDTFDIDNESSNFTATSNGGPVYPGTWTWTSDGNGGGYVYSPQQGTGPTNDHYPHYLRNTPAAFCFGEIEADILIQNGTTNWDGMITFRDNGVADNCVAYGVGLSQDTSPGHLYLQKSVPAYTPLTAVNPISINFNQWYTVKVLVSDAGNGAVRIQASVWPTGQPDPGVWYIDYTDSTGIIPSCGKVGFQACPFNPDEYDNLKISESVHTNPVLYDTIPSQITYQGGTPASVTVNSAPVNSGGVVSWNITTQLANTLYHFEWYGIINYCGTVLNKGTFAAQNGFGAVDSNTVSLNVPICPQTATFTPTYTITNTYTMTPTYTPTVTMTVTLTQTPSPIIPQFTLSKAESQATAEIGDTVTYTISYFNTGLIDLTNLSVWDTLPSGLDNITTISPAGGNYNSSTGVVSWLIPDVPINSSGDLLFSGVMNNSVTRNQVLANTAFGTVTGGQATVNSNTVNLTANVPELQLTPIMNYPNPFGAGGNDTTTIVFGLTVQAAVEIKFFTISGETVKVMTYPELKSKLVGQADTQKGVNKVLWDGTNTSGNRLASGIYFYRVEATRGGEKCYYISKLAVLR